MYVEKVWRPQIFSKLINIFPLHSTIDNNELHDFKSILRFSIQIIVLVLKHTHINGNLDDIDLV